MQNLSVAAIPPWIADLLDLLAVVVEHKKISPRLMIDVGSHDAQLALLLAERLGVQGVLLTDIEPNLPASLVEKVPYAKVDAASTKFLDVFRGGFTLSTCLRSVHEFADPEIAIRNILETLRPGGLAIFVDYSEAGWEHQRAGLESGETWPLHFAEDIRNMELHGLSTDQGITDFWIRKIYRHFRGTFEFTFHGHLYMVTYQAPIT